MVTQPLYNFFHLDFVNRNLPIDLNGLEFFSLRCLIFVVHLYTFEIGLSSLEMAALSFHYDVLSSSEPHYMISYSDNQVLSASIDDG